MIHTTSYKLLQTSLQDLATELSAGIGQGGDEDCSNFGKFSVECKLSDKGLQQYERVVEMVFQYINMLKREGPQVSDYQQP